MPEPSSSEASRDSNQRIKPTTRATDTASTATQYKSLRNMAVQERSYRLGRLSDGAGGLLRANPALLPALLATVTFVVLGASEAGFYPTSWYPAGLFLLGLLAASLLALGIPRGLPRPVLAALVLIGAYTAWSYLSITWAGQPGPAWDGANRTAMYLAAFALFALWPFDARGATTVLAVLGLGIAGIGLFELLKANGAAEPGQYFIDVRFAEPAGYMNANVALWTIGLLPCLFLASRRAVPAPVRGLALGGAGILVGLALLGQSRGWVLALPLALVVFLIVCPGRVRLLAAIVGVGVAAFAVSGPALAVHDDWSPGRLDPLLSEATRAILIAAAMLAAAGLLAALVDRRVAPGPATRRRIGWAAAVLVGLALVGAVAVQAVAGGSPTGRAAEAWNDFKEGGQGPQAGGSRFAGGSGTNRYEFWTVAWDSFRDRPLRGMGAENFQEEYLRRGTSGEQPLYAHSFELGVLSQTGVIGGVLLLGGLAAAAAGAFRARRSREAERAAAAAAAAVFVYWLLHASVDWFWELPALTGPAVALLGMAIALAPRASGQSRELPLPAAGQVPSGSTASRSGRRRPLMLALGALAVLALAVSFALPWLAALEVKRASETWAANPDAALQRLDRAESLNPLSARAPLTAATIALRVNRVRLAQQEFREALRREPRSVYALLELGAIAASEGDRATGLRLLRQARALSPQDPGAERALRSLRRGRPLDLGSLNRSIVERANRLGTQVD
jgi:tetratricopeptide (TPR) repeat protein